jgi:hypothetical protein
VLLQPFSQDQTPVLRFDLAAKRPVDPVTFGPVGSVFCEIDGQQLVWQTRLVGTAIVWTNNGTLAGNLTIDGNLQVNGTTTLTVLNVLQTITAQQNIRSVTGTIQGKFLVSDFDITAGNNILAQGSIQSDNLILARTGFRRDIGPFWRDGVAANLIQDPVDYDPTTNNLAGWIARRDGWISGLSASTDIPAAGGSLTIEILKNGVIVPGVQLIIAAGFRSGFLVLPDNAGPFQFLAGDEIQPVISTPALWSSTTLRAYIQPEVAN